MDSQPHDIFPRVSGCIQSSGIADTTAMQLLERYAAQPELQATLQTIFTTIEGVLTGQEKTVNDYDTEILRITNEVQDLTAKNTDLQVGLQNCEEEPLIMYPTMYTPTVHRSVRCLLCWDTGRPLSDIWSAFEHVYSRQGPTLFRGPG